MPVRTSTFSDYIHVSSLSRSFGDRRVLSDIDLVVEPGSRVGLIGENGAGKSTLLRTIAGDEPADAGTLSTPRRLGLLRQEVGFGGSVRQLLESAMAEVRGIERELEAAASAIEADGGLRDGGAERYDAALAAATRAEVWSVDARRDELLEGLGVAGLPLDRALDEVSGGQRSRFALAGLLLERPDALLLDEPTNHLDDSAVEVLRRQLLGWQGPVLFASHDRAFLDEVATDLVDIDPSRSGARRFGGGYSDYLAEKAAERGRWETQFAAEQEELKRLRAATNVTARDVSNDRGPRDNDKFLAGFKSGRIDVAVRRRVRNAEVRLETLEREQVRKPPAPLEFGGIPHGSHPLEPGVLVQVAGARVSGRFEVQHLQVGSGSRMLVTGANGSGKSSLLTALAGRLSLDAGSIERRKGLRMALLEQDVRFADPALSPRAIYDALVGERRAESVPLSGLGLVAPRDLDRPVGVLSVGQQRRLALALIIARPPHLFLLDEPTNHLSLTLATELEDALGAYPGAVVVASHDRWLRRRWAGERFAMAA
jgi:macrolide transport system ATP-binding/permease protein